MQEPEPSWPGDPRRELAAGLLQPAARIAPKFFYDRLGSALFAAICQLEEYYPTRTERAVLAQCREELATLAGAGRTLIDLGAGDCVKAERLFALLKPRRYVALDISADFLADALARLRREHQGLVVNGYGCDFTGDWSLPDEVPRDSRLFLYPGSSIGNFSPDEARAFLARLRTNVEADGQLLIGVDLVKDSATLEAAYDDALGVTAAFNRNMLLHVNRLLGADFALADWRHVALFEPVQSRIEMHLEALRPVTVSWPGGSRRFGAGERIHTENSYKYRQDDFARLLALAGWKSVRCWTDPRRWFAVILARAV